MEHLQKVAVALLLLLSYTPRYNVNNCQSTILTSP